MAKIREDKYAILYPIIQLEKHSPKIQANPTIGKRVKIGNTGINKINPLISPYFEYLNVSIFIAIFGI